MATNKAVYVGDHDDGCGLRELSLLARRQETRFLFHYTSAATAISHILGDGTLRLSPFESLNDLWEARPKYPGLSSHHDDRLLVQEAGLTDAVWMGIDRQIRLHAKATCLVRDFDLPDEAWIRDAERGWAHLSQWDRYGAGHTGVCLGFDREALVHALEEYDDNDGALRFHGRISYHLEPPTMREADLGQVRHFGVDAAAVAFAEANPRQLFLSKHRDWMGEYEYRLVLVDQSLDAAYLPIRQALTEVYLGDAFPDYRIADLIEVLAGYPSVAPWKLRFFNRGWHKSQVSVPPPAAGARGTPSPPSDDRLAPGLDGSLVERLAALRAAQREARNLRARAEETHGDLARTIAHSVGELCTSLSAWPATQARVHQPTTQAVPEPQRAHAAGVPGERVHWESGAQCIVTGQPSGTPTVWAAAAVQVLDGGSLRLHAVVQTDPGPDGRAGEDHWRAEREVLAAAAEEALAELLDELRAQAEAVRPTFEGLSDGG